VKEVLALVLAAMVAVAAVAQEKKKAPPKKPVAAKPVAHQKASPEQIRKFNELEKKRQKKL